MENMTTNTLHTCSYECDRPECVRAQRDYLRDRLEALTAVQQPAGDGCHCGTCTCNPNMTPAVRYDLSPAQQEGAIREHLIRLGWTPSKRRPYNASGSLSEYGVFPECDAQQPDDDEVVFIDGVGAGRSSIKSCRDGVQWIMVGDRVYWPLSDSDAKRLQSACCGNGSFDDPAAALATHRKGGSDNG